MLRNQPGGTVQARGSTKCLQCDKEISLKAKIYCSILCQQKYKRKSRLIEWLNGSWDGSSSQGASKIVKDYLLNECGNKCSKCGWNEINQVTNKIPLEVNHIDGDSTNNNVENLEILCPNCHSLTPNYRALNKNSRREYRRK